MKLFLVGLLSFAISANGTLLHIGSVKIPLYLHGADTDPTIEITEVPFVTAYMTVETRINAMAKPYIPLSDDSWIEGHDINLVSLYGIRVSGRENAVGTGVNVKLDLSAAAVPEGYPFSLAEVVTAIEKCVRQMLPGGPPDKMRLKVEIIE